MACTGCLPAFLCLTAIDKMLLAFRRLSVGYSRLDFKVFLGKVERHGELSGKLVKRRKNVLWRGS